MEESVILSESASCSSFDSDDFVPTPPPAMVDEKPPRQMKMPIQNEDAEGSYLLWDWPLNAVGFVKCHTNEKKIRVALDFKSLKAESCNLQTTSMFDQLKANSFCWSVGLCSIKSECQSFARLEIQAHKHLHMIAVEAFREIYRGQGGPGRTLKRLRKVFKLPEDVDMSSIRAKVATDGTVILEATRVVPPEQKRKDSRPSLSRGSSTASDSSL